MRGMPTVLSVARVVITIAAVFLMQRDLRAQQGFEADVQSLSQVEALDESTTRVWGHSTFGDKELEALIRLKNLQFLGLWNCQVTDKGLRRISQFKNLEILSIRGGSAITAEGLSVISDIRSLKTLVLNQTSIEARAIFDTAAKVPQLKRLEVLNSSVQDSDLGGCKALTSLRTLCLDQNFQLTDAGIAHIAALPLVELSLQCAFNITDESLKLLAGMNNLESLDLGWCEKISDSGVAHLGKLSQLRSLSLCQNTQLTDKALEPIGAMKSLERLNLGSWINRPVDFTCLFYCSFTDEGVSQLSQLPKLRELTLDGCIHLSDAAFSDVAKFKDLEVLSVDACEQLTTGTLQRLRGLARLKQVNFQSMGVKASARGFAGWACAATLESLQFGGKADNAGLAAIGAFKHLKELELLLSGEFTEDGMLPLGNLTSLVSARLYIEGAKHWRCLEGIAKSPQLVNLQIGGNGVPDCDVALLGSSRSLAKLTLRYNQELTGTGLRALSKVPLQEIDLADCHALGTEGLKALADIPTLRCVELSDTSVSGEEAFEAFAKNLKLERLFMRRCNQISNAAAMKLAGMKTLRELSLWECIGVSDETAKALAAALPDCRVAHRAIKQQ